MLTLLDLLQPSLCMQYRGSISSVYSEASTSSCIVQKTCFFVNDSCQQVINSRLHVNYHYIHSSVKASSFSVCILSGHVQFDECLFIKRNYVYQTKREHLLQHRNEIHGGNLREPLETCNVWDHFQTYILHDPILTLM